MDQKTEDVLKEYLSDPWVLDYNARIAGVHLMALQHNPIPCEYYDAVTKKLKITISTDYSNIAEKLARIILAYTIENYPELFVSVE